MRTVHDIKEEDRTPWLAEKLPRREGRRWWGYDADDPIKTLVRRYDHAVVRKGGQSIFALKAPTASWWESL